MEPAQLDGPLHTGIQQRQVLAALAHLSRRDAVALVLTYYGSKSADGVADALSLDTPDVLTALHDAAHALRATLSGSDAPGSGQRGQLLGAGTPRNRSSR